MADPRNELADIIVLAAPEITAAGGSGVAGWTAAGLIAGAGFVLLAWLWHCRRPVRALREIAAAAAQRQSTPSTLAARLDTWARMHFRLARVDAARCPPSLDAAVWADWATTLARLRFAPPQSNGFEELTALCRTARAWRRRA